MSGTRPPAQFAETPKQARRFMDELYREAYLPGKVTAVDTEFVPVSHEPVLLSYSWGRGVRRVVRAELVKEHFGDWLVDDGTKLAYQNYKEDVETLGALGLPEADLARSFYIDVMVAGVLRDETLVKHSLKAQMFHFLKWFRREYGQIFAYVPDGKKKAIVMDPRQVMDNLPEAALTGAVVKWGGAKGNHGTGARSADEWRRVMVDYAGDDAEGTQIIAVDHRRYLRKTDYWDKYVAVDRPFTLTLMQCEKAGVFIDQPILHKILRKQDIRLLRSQHCFRAAAGNPKLNLRSGPQMKKLLFDEWGWPEHPSVQTDSGGVSMDKEVLGWWLREHKLQMAEVKLAFNNASTLKGTFLEGILKGVSEDGRLRSDLNQIGAKTSGRISSRKFDVLTERSKTLKSGEVKTWIETEKAGANLQNIPARKEKDPDGIRGTFRAPRVGEVTAWGDKAAEPHKLLVADYSGFHLVLVIHFVSKLTKESAMLEIMKKYKTPSAVHVYTCIQMFKHAAPHRCDPASCKDKKTGEWKKYHGENKSFSLKEFTMDDWKLVKPLFPDQYTYSKNTNFALIFLGSPWTLAYNTGRDANNEEQLEECKRHFDDWYDLYPEIKTYQNHFIDHGYEHGWVPTLGGRRGHVRKMLEGCGSDGRYINDEEKRKKMIKHGERVCTNTPAQGCIHRDTLILSRDHGVVPISDLNGQEITVWDGGKWANARVAESGEKRELVVRFYGGLEIRCSPDHRFLVSGETGVHSWKTAGEFRKQQFVVLSDGAEWQNYVAWPEETGSRAKQVSVNHLNEFDQGLFVGRVASDGWVRPDNSVRLMVAEHEKDIIPKLKKLCEKVGKVVMRTLDRTDEGRQPFHYLEIYSAALARQLSSLKGYIPKEIWSSSRRLRGYLCGLFDGDGTVGRDGPKLTFGGGHRYESWAREVQQALFMLGIRSRLQFGQDSRIDVNVQKADVRRYEEQVGFLGDSKREKLSHVKPQRSDEPAYGRVLRVAEVIDTGNYVPMYDVVDSETHQFAAAGVVTHNSEADIVKMAFNLMCASKKLIALRVAPLFPVHDEAVCEGPERTAVEGLEEQIRLMKEPYKDEMEVELAVEGGIGDNWIAAKP